MAGTKERRRISDKDILDIVLMRLAGATLESVAKRYGVAKQTVQYHEDKDLARELRAVVLKRAAKTAGDAIGTLAFEKLSKRELNEIVV